MSISKKILWTMLLLAMICASAFAQVVTDFTNTKDSGLVQHGDFAIRNGVLESYTGTAVNVTIPANLGITAISRNAFGNNLVSVVIPEGVTTFSFRECYNLQSVTIPNTVTIIGDYAFHLTSVTSIVIPNSVTSIGDFAFYRCTSLTSVVIPNSVIRIRDRAFLDCTSLTSVTIPNSVISIGSWAFANSASLTSITIPDTITYIAPNAFSNCRNLRQVIVTQTGADTSYIRNYFRDYEIIFRKI